MPGRGELRSQDTRSCIALACWSGVQTLAPARLFSSWVLQDHPYEMVDARVGRQVKDEARESPVRFLESLPLESTRRTLERLSGASEEVFGLCSLLALNIVR
jgi:hypothetical protein